MKPLIRYALFLIALLSLNACDSEEIYEVGDVRYTDSSALFGVWELQVYDYLRIAKEPSGRFLLLDSNERSIYLQRLYQSDSTEIYVIGEAIWSLDNERILSSTPNWSAIYANVFAIDPDPLPDTVGQGFSQNGKHVYSFTVSSLDSVKSAIERVGVDDGKPMYAYSDIKFAIISDYTNGAGVREIGLVTDSCYQAHQGAASLKDVCDVWDYRKVSMPLFDELLQHVDTLSSTEIWKALEAYAAKWNK